MHSAFLDAVYGYSDTDADKWNAPNVLFNPCNLKTTKSYIVKLFTKMNHVYTLCDYTEYRKANLENGRGCRILSSKKLLIIACT